MDIVDLAGVGKGEDFLLNQSIDDFTYELRRGLGSEGGFDDILQLGPSAGTILRGFVAQLLNEAVETGLR